MTPTIRISVAAIALAATPAVAAENAFAPQLTALAQAELAAYAAAPAVVEAVRAQNARHGGIDAARIEDLDQAWRAQVGTADRPMIDAVLDTPASGWLREQTAASGGLLTEIFVTDAHGLNAAQSDVTSDYWQGDEAKFTEVFGKPAGSMWIGEIEMDESTQTYQSQVSMPVVDPATGGSMGTITVGVNLALIQ